MKKIIVRFRINFYYQYITICLCLIFEFIVAILINFFKIYINVNELENIIYIFISCIFILIILVQLLWQALKLFKSPNSNNKGVLINSLQDDYNLFDEKQNLFEEYNVYFLETRNNKYSYCVINLQKNIKLNLPIMKKFDVGKDTLIILPKEFAASYIFNAEWSDSSDDTTTYFKYFISIIPQEDGTIKKYEISNKKSMWKYNWWRKFIRNKSEQEKSDCIKNNFINSFNSLKNYYFSNDDKTQELENELKKEKNNILISGSRGTGKTEYIKHYFDKNNSVFVSANNERAYGDPISIIYTQIRNQIDPLNRLIFKLIHILFNVFRLRWNFFVILASIGLWGFIFNITNKEPIQLGIKNLLSEMQLDQLRDLFINYTTLSYIILFIVIYFVLSFFYLDAIVFIKNTSSYNRNKFLNFIDDIYKWSQFFTIIIEDIDRLGDESISNEKLYDWKSEIASLSDISKKYYRSNPGLIVAVSKYKDDNKNEKAIFNTDEINKYFDLYVEYNEEDTVINKGTKMKLNISTVNIKVSKGSNIIFKENESGNYEVNKKPSIPKIIIDVTKGVEDFKQKIKDSVIVNKDNQDELNAKIEECTNYREIHAFIESNLEK